MIFKTAAGARFPAVPVFGTPEGTRTPDLLLRRQLLYTVELLSRFVERVTGIRTEYPGWKAGVLPFNDTR